MKKLFTRIDAYIIGLSAFLLFLVQPMVAKFLLPSFGGAASVWTTSVLFFMVALFVGYLYVYFLARFPFQKQLRIHLYVAGGVVALTALQVLLRGSMFGEAFVINAGLPEVSTLFALFSLVGLPYLLLSTTGPLVQHWVALRDQEEPYYLYAISNAGSLLGLLSYPFFLEALLRVSMQGWLFFLLFLLYAVTLLFLIRQLFSSHAREEAVSRSHPPLKTIATWLALAALPSALLLSTTTQVTSTIAPIPFLWVFPLALYLISMILAFRGIGKSGYFSVFLVFLIVVAFFNLDWEFEAATRKIALFLGILFLTSLIANYALYARRPDKKETSFFYLMLAAGGSIGAMLVGFVAPLTLNDYYEFPVLLAAAGALGVLVFPGKRYIKDEFLSSVRDWKVACLGIVIAVFATTMIKDDYPSLSILRNFYGVTQVYEDEDKRSLMHGTTMHGNQLVDPEKKYLPSSYYTASSGIGRSILHHELVLKKGALTVGTVGLGTGSLAAYCREKDTYVFYEIDPRIEQVAREYFTYLEYCKNSSVRIGDGRLTMQKEIDDAIAEPFDVLAIDAFSDDTIPTHLLTVEALRMYRARMKDENSIIAIHTSNRYIRLVPTVLAAANEAGLYGQAINDPGEIENAASSEWVLLVQNEAVFNSPQFKDVLTTGTSTAVAWTDDYSNILPALDLPALFPEE